ncbi:MULTISPECIES: helix-turn-helix domain-containing protein [unclassified Carboxylicivirga]|uniref:helix-turn-helix domain-containing protein n=1 Tax=Carboxylicivirga TaxID=1628153 RepID=UPI003D333112
MKSRIQALLKHEGMTPSQFADAIGVQRSGVSHILAGRNKPSVDFLSKLMARFPHISGDWLITGQGEMLRAEAAAAVKDRQLHLSMEQERPATSFKMPKKALKEEPEPVYETLSKPQQPVLPPLPKAEGKRIERIIVFYDDRSFSEFRPETP